MCGKTFTRLHHLKRHTTGLHGSKGDTKKDRTTIKETVIVTTSDEDKGQRSQVIYLHNDKNSIQFVAATDVNKESKDQPKKFLGKVVEQNGETTLLLEGDYDNVKDEFDSGNDKIVFLSVDRL